MRIAIAGIGLGLLLVLACSPRPHLASLTSTSCITDGVMVGVSLSRAKSFAVDAARLSLPPYDASAVSVVTVDSLCRSAANAGFGLSEMVRPVVTIALDTSGYLVYAPWDRTTSGEWTCDTAILDNTFRGKVRLCS